MSPQVTEKGFKKEYAFLSNFRKLDSKMCCGGIVYSSIEHYYQAMKTKNVEHRRLIAEHPSKGLKKFCKELVELREDWDDIRVAVMRYGLEFKFGKANLYLRNKLLSTGDTELVEYNWHKDFFWGKSFEGEGENMLGKLLMETREKIKSGIL